RREDDPVRGCRVFLFVASELHPGKAVDVDQTVARASTLSSPVYLDPAAYEQEKERIFGRTWQLVARADELARVGDLKPATILDEPILITHGLDRTLRGFYNVCRHRAAQVVLSRGNRKSLQCPYHGWTYGLDGKLQGARGGGGTENGSQAGLCRHQGRRSRLGAL